MVKIHPFLTILYEGTSLPEPAYSICLQTQTHLQSCVKTFPANPKLHYGALSLHYSVYETKKQILWSTDGLSWHSYIIRRLFALSLFLCHPSLSLLPPIFLFLPNSAFLPLSWIIQQRRRRLQRQHEKDRNEEGPRVDGDWLTDCRAFSKGMNSHPSPPPPPQQKKTK